MGLRALYHFKLREMQIYNFSRFSHHINVLHLPFFQDSML